MKTESKKSYYATANDSEIGRVDTLESAVDDYFNHVAEAVGEDLSGMEVALDCSNGSSSRTAEKLFTKLGVKVHMLFDEPDGININKDCGSTHTKKLQEYVRKNKLSAGLAFDGDADRCLAVDENGNLVDGDFLIAICANDMKKNGKLKKNTAVGTVMTNMGFSKFCEANGIDFVSTKVGDRYVLESMLQNGYIIGGEQSGHIIFSKYASTGDGILTSLKMMEVMLAKKMPMSKLAEPLKIYPQVLENVRVTDKKAAQNDPAVQEAVKAVAEALGDTGRILVRESGTEPLVRVMVEAPDHDTCQKYVSQVVEVIKNKGYAV